MNIRVQMEGSTLPITPEPKRALLKNAEHRTFVPFGTRSFGRDFVVVAGPHFPRLIDRIRRTAALVESFAQDPVDHRRS
jgi:hypothetical protein